MSEGPTTVGSIVAHLRIGRGALSPTIRVDANVSEALAQVEAVRAALGAVNGN